MSVNSVNSVNSLRLVVIDSDNHIYFITYSLQPYAARAHMLLYSGSA